MTRLTVDIPDTDASLGPAMQELGERPRAYVVAMVTTGCTEVQAAYAAGYGEDSDTAERRRNCVDAAVFRLRRDEKVLAAIREETQKRLDAGVAIAANALLAMVMNPLDKNHYKAVDRILGQAGMVVATKHEVNVTHKEERRTDAQILERITALANKHGIDLQKLLPSRVVDAEFEVVQTGGSTEGLEDLL